MSSKSNPSVNSFAKQLQDYGKKQHEIFQSLLPKKPVPASGLRELSSRANQRSNGQGFPQGQSTGNMASLMKQTYAFEYANTVSQENYRATKLSTDVGVDTGNMVSLQDQVIVIREQNLLKESSIYS